jgi:hypothetical protein
MNKFQRYLRILRSLAYDPVLFERCTRLIVKIAESGKVDDDRNEARRIFASLFPIRFSGTHATIEQRLAVIRSLLLSGDPKKRALGVAALKGALEAVHFGSEWDFEFGTQSRDYGFWPRSRDDVTRWFGQSLALAESIACSEEPAAMDVRSSLAEQFRGLWNAAGIHDELEKVFRQISQRKF